MLYWNLPPAASIRSGSPLQIPLSMLILFDHVPPRGIAQFLPGHTVTLAKERGWDTLTNGDLLAEAGHAGFDVLLTADKTHAPSAEPYRPQNSPCGTEHTTMASCSTTHRKNCNCCEFCYARQLCRS